MNNQQSKLQERLGRIFRSSIAFMIPLFIFSSILMVLFPNLELIIVKCFGFYMLLPFSIMSVGVIAKIFEGI